MDATILTVAAFILIAVVAAVYVLRRRAPKPALAPLSGTSVDRTFVGIASAPRRSDVTTIGPSLAPSDVAALADEPTAVETAPPLSAPTLDEPIPAIPAPDATQIVGADAAPRAVPSSADDTSPTVIAARPRPRGRLVIRSGGTGGPHELQVREYVIGRSSTSDIILTDPSVSAHHARLVPHGDDFAIRDVSSTNATTVDGNPVKGDHALHGGESIVLGEARLGYERM